MKVDFGVHVKGRIVDSAFTMSWDPTYDKLLEAVKAATDTGVRVSSAVPVIFLVCGFYERFPRKLELMPG
jgi:methionine aminopeptidase